MDENTEAKIYSILKTLRKDLFYTVAVSEITSLSLDSEKCAAFLIYVITNCFGQTYTTDIVLGSFALLKEYSEITSVDTRRTFVSIDLGYDGKPESLYRIENTAYQKMARYLSPFFGNKDTSIKLVRNALKSEFYDQENKKAVRPVSFCKMTRMEGNPIRHFIGDPKHLFSLNADVEILKMFNFDPVQVVVVDYVLSQIFPEALIDEVLNSPEHTLIGGYYITEEERKRQESLIDDFFENYDPNDPYKGLSGEMPF